MEPILIKGQAGMTFGPALIRSCEPKGPHQSTGKRAPPSAEQKSLVSRGSSTRRDSGTVEDKESERLEGEEKLVGAREWMRGAKLQSRLMDGNLTEQIRRSGLRPWVRDGKMVLTED